MVALAASARRGPRRFTLLRQLTKTIAEEGIQFSAGQGSIGADLRRLITEGDAIAHVHANRDGSMVALMGPMAAGGPAVFAQFMAHALNELPEVFRQLDRAEQQLAMSTAIGMISAELGQEVTRRMGCAIDQLGQWLTSEHTPTPAELRELRAMLSGGQEQPQKDGGR